MMEVIIDTNVAVVANSQNPQVVQRCIDACTAFLVGVVAGGIVLLDEGDAIRKEYARALGTAKPQQVGAQFLMFILQQQYNPARVRRVSLSLRNNGEFVDFPTSVDLSRFDPSDRKFAALARKTGVPVTNAVDSDWAENLTALKKNGVAVEFLCGPESAAWFVNRP